ncbi:hypothetical protein HAHE_24860 [Haloferula helveola]|uniref:Helix-turn-helix domain-containing protein n=1 Tax=Haloferula helveola TaxID=490095 RepID=A0ABN6H9D5_9BACT|nr:hypothetical protein HAHE_24860 [Haloferula helveola]
MTTAQRTASLTPMDKLAVLVGDVDQLRTRIEGIAAQQSIDDMLEVLEIEALACRFGVSQDTLRRRLREAGGKVFKLGRKHVIRKVAFLEVIETLESDDFS